MPNYRNRQTKRGHFCQVLKGLWHENNVFRILRGPVAFPQAEKRLARGGDSLAH